MSSATATASDTLQPAAYGFTITFFILATFSVGLRIYARAHVVENFGWDDWAMVAVGVINTGQNAILFLFLDNGSGLHITEVMTQDPVKIATLLKILFAEEIYYMLLLWLIKISILLFYLRLSPNSGFRRIVYSIIALNTLATVTCWFIYCFQCNPLDAVWDTAVAALPGTKCLPSLFLFFFPASLNIFIDFVIFFLPMRIIWEMKASLRRKISLMGILGIGLIAIIVSCLRLIILYRFSISTDITWLLGYMVIVSCVEIDLAIIAANVPSFKSLWIKYVRKGQIGKSSSQNHNHASYELSDDSGRSKSSKRSRSRDHLDKSGGLGSVLPREDSQEELFGVNVNGIKGGDGRAGESQG
ncbi:hypothetical protein RUND412_000976 [Rhizina undulata]